LLPFAYALSYLAGNRETNFCSRQRIYLLLAVFVLGFGLILGAVWAYEDLTFGGFWSWDPVENASLIPWILLLAALHLNLLIKKGKTLMPTLLFFSYMPFVLVLYAAFLTRSGVLSNTSAHSFSGASPSYLFGYLSLTFFIIPLAIQMARRKKQTDVVSQTSFLSKDFFIFAGSIVLILSAFHILFATSLPVINHFFGTQLSVPNDSTAFFNEWQMVFASFLCFMTALAALLKYTKTNLKVFAKSGIWSFALALSVTLLLFFLLNLKGAYTIFLFTVLFSIFASLDQMFRLKYHQKNISASISHIGLAVFLLGVILSFGCQSELHISEDISKPVNNGITMVKGLIYDLTENYSVSYSQRGVKEDRYYYRIDFLNKKENKYYLSFAAFPSLRLHDAMGHVYIPHTRHFLTKDVFTYLTHAEITSDSYQYVTGDTISHSDTITLKTGILYFNSDSTESTIKMFYQRSGGFSWDTIISTADSNAIHEFIMPGAAYKAILYPPYHSQTIISLMPEKMDFIVLKIKIFPLVNMVWGGLLLMLAGMLLSVFRRKIKKKMNDTCG
jgi:cytochrome c-type biogenesis protein CcmF